MSILQDKLSHLTTQILSDISEMTMDDKFKIKIECPCGNVSIIGVRSLSRRWPAGPYLCKSCHVRTYAGDEEKLEKFRKSFAETASTTEHKEKCSKAAKKLWADPELRKRVSEAVSEDNKTNPKKVEGRKKAVIAFMEKHGRKKLLEMRVNQRGKQSILEDIFCSILDGMGIEHQRQFPLGHNSYDVYVPHKNLLVEIQGEYWHKNSVGSDSAKATYAIKSGYDIKHLWENEFSEIGKVESLIKQWFGLEDAKQINFSFNDIKIRKIDSRTVRGFLGKYHYLPALSKFGIHIGAYLGDNLVASATFSAITRKETATRLKVSTKSIRELGRFCIAPQYHRKNFASWFLSRATKMFKNMKPEIEALISFADTTMHDGGVYKASNWKYDGEARKNYMYRSSDGFLIHKKTVWDRAKKMQISEQKYAESHEYIKVWSKTKKRFVFSYGDR